MFNDIEYQQLSDAYRSCIQSIKKYRQAHNVSLSQTPLQELYQPLYILYEELAGFEAEFDAEEIMSRHYLSRWKN